MISIEKILQKADEEKEKAHRLVSVDKQIDLTYDLAHLAAFDLNPIDLERFKNEKEDYIHSLSRDNTQLLINKIWDLETKRVDNVITAILPPPIYYLPRAKPIPKPKPPTKWELFAKAKGIQKRKKERMVWDEVTQQWKPRFGYRSIAQQKQQNEWLIEVPDNAPNPNEDFFAKKLEAKSERTAKNELQRLRNLSKNQKLKLPGMAGIIPNQDLKKDDLIRAKELVKKKSNASMGKFFEQKTMSTTTTTKPSIKAGKSNDKKPMKKSSNNNDRKSMKNSRKSFKNSKNSKNAKNNNKNRKRNLKNKKR